MLSSMHAVLILSLCTMFALGLPLSSKDGVDFPELKYSTEDEDKFPLPPKIIPVAQIPVDEIKFKIPQDELPDKLDKVLENLKNGQNEDISNQLEAMKTLIKVLSKKQFYAVFREIAKNFTGEAKVNLKLSLLNMNLY